MDLQHLCTAKCANVYYDNVNNWGFVDWVGDLTLAAVQHTCLEIAQCFLGRYYPRVLNSNERVTSVSWEVSTWLASEFLPALSLTGVEQMAWVVPASLRVRNKVLDTVNLFPHIAINLFDDMEQAVAWLQQTAPAQSVTGCFQPSRLQADEAKLRAIVNDFARRLAAASPAG